MLSILHQNQAPQYFVAYPVMVSEPPMMLPFTSSEGPMLFPVMSAPIQQPITLWAPEDIPVIPDLKQYLPLSKSPSSSSNSEPTGARLSLPEVNDSFPSRSRSGSLSSCDYSDWSSEVENTQPRGHKQELITQVRETLGTLLVQHFSHRMEGTIMSVFAHEHIPELNELEDVLRGNNVGNIRAKSVQSLNVLVEFLQSLLACPNVSVHRVDVILQKKRTGHLKGLLVNMQFSNQDELLYVRDAIWKGEGFDKFLPKFMPAVFAQDCSWKGSRPKDLHYVQSPSSGELRVQHPLPEKLQKLELEANCRVKSITVIFKTSKNKTKTFEVPKDQFHLVLSEGKFIAKGVQRKLNEKTQLTVSFEEDWKTDFWRC